jgi:hypothetical protein
MPEFHRRSFLKGMTVAGATGMAGIGPLEGRPLEAPGASARSAGGGTAQSSTPGVARKFWINTPQVELPSRPWRKIHLDFHNSEHIGEIGTEFDAERSIMNWQLG